MPFGKLASTANSLSSVFKLNDDYYATASLGYQRNKSVPEL